MKRKSNSSDSHKIEKRTSHGDTESESNSTFECRPCKIPWSNIIAAVIVGLIGVFSTNITDHIKWKTDIAIKCDELSRGKSDVERQLQDLRHEKNLSAISVQDHIERLKNESTSKDRKIEELQRENSEQRIRLEGKEVLIEQLRSCSAAKIIKDPKVMTSEIMDTSTRPIVIVAGERTFTPSVSRKFDIELSTADIGHARAATIAYAAHDFSNAVRQARVIYGRIGCTLESKIGKPLFVHTEFASVISPVCRIIAEDSFSCGDFASAVTQSWLAVCLERPHPKPFTLALHSAAHIRSSSYAEGFLTGAIHDFINRQAKENRDEYRRQILSKLCQLGYLQIAYPNHDATDVGDIIDWGKLMGIEQPFRYRKEGQADLWSLRWEGFGRYSEYNYSKAFRKGLTISKEGVP